jgi:histidyl-tRNA synthetase
MRAFDATDRGTREVMKDAPKLLDRLAPEDAEHFAQVRALLEDAGIVYAIDPTLVRGLDYYTRTVFEFSSDALGAQSGVAGGGRYDRLIEQLEGPPTPACGWAAGVERILLAAGDLPVSGGLVDLYVALAKPGGARAAFGLAREARRAGLQAQLELTGRSLKGQLKHADRIGARYVAIVGENTVASLRDMESGDQRDLEIDNVIPTILRGSRLS